MDAHTCPRLRPVESILVTDPAQGRILLLRDPQGIAEGHAALPAMFAAVVGRFTGALTCDEIARQASREFGASVPVEVVVQLAEQLDHALFLEGLLFRTARARAERGFADAAVRPASHAGAAYHAEPVALDRYIREACLGRAESSAAPGEPPPHSGRPIVALIAPHIDPWRGAVGYGHAYGALAAALPSEVDTFVLFGTSHAPMAEPFALCRKGFDTPFGLVPCDTESIDALAARSDGFDPYADQFNHKREHSLEFQVVFLKHLLNGRPFRIVPVLAGLAPHQATREDPKRDRRVAEFMGGIRDIVASKPGRVVVVAGADMAHVGPRFGDAEARDEKQRAALEHADRESLGRAASLDAEAFWSHVVGDLDARRVCGLAPIWSLLRAVGESGAEGRVLHYEQTIDADDGSIVSHAAVGFYA